jgi:hypothetical protein
VIIERLEPPAEEASAGASRHHARALTASNRSRRGVSQALAIRVQCRRAAVFHCLPLCMTLAASAALGVGLPAAAAPAIASPAASPDAVKIVQVVQLPPTVDRRVLLDLRELLSHPGHVVVVEVLAPAALADGAVAELTGIADASTDSPLVVSMDDERGGGPAGALVFALASVRVGEPKAVAAAKQQSDVTALGPPCQGRCRQAFLRRVAGASFHVAYPTLSAYLAVLPVQVRVVPSGVLGGTGSSRGSPIWGIVLVGMLAVGAAAGWYLALRGRLRTPPASRRRRANLPATPQARRPEGRRSPVRAEPVRRRAGPLVPDLAASSSVHEGQVRTELHPQGYVELDGCLYRATWIGSGGRGPGPGEPVRVTADRARGLVAFPVASPAGPSSLSTRADPSQPGL